MTEEVIKSITKRPNPKARKLYNHWDIEEPYTWLQADLLYLPTDNRYKYALTVVDIASRFKWAAPLRSRNAEAVKEAFYSLKIPIEKVKVLMTDAGSEFAGVFKKSLSKSIDGIDLYIEHRIQKPGHHLSFVENFNGHLAVKLFDAQYIEELKTGKPAKFWVNNLSVVVDKMNNTVTSMIKMKPIDAVKLEKVPQKKNKFSKKDISLKHENGTKVRRLLEKDQILDVSSNKIRIENRRRKTDPYWSLDIYTVVSSYRSCDECIHYHIVEHEGNVYPTKFNYWELQPV